MILIVGEDYIMQTMKTKKLTAWIAVIAVLFVMLFSVIFVSEHIDHDCTGAECPVCAVMEQCSINIHSLGTVITVSVAFILCISILKGVQHITAVYTDYSLISQKVRMNN